MQNVPLRKALAKAPDPARAQHYFELLRANAGAAVLESLSTEQARVLFVLLSGSQALSEVLIRHAEWLRDLVDLDFLRRARRKEELLRQAEQRIDPLVQQSDITGSFRELREFKQRETLRIAVRDLARMSDLSTVTRELSDLADVCLEWVYQLCWRNLRSRFGQPFHQDADGSWRETKFCVIGLGKLGGQELNYSSDVDVIMVYSEEGAAFRQPPRKPDRAERGLSNHQLFLRLAEQFIAEVSRLADAGSLYRIDLRLRPEGKAGPLVRSLSSYENYYAQWGQTWERMMLIKARFVAGDASLAAEFVEMVQPFRYPRSLHRRVLQEIATMKDRIELEVVKAGELERNVKLGRGGIREIEFVTQTLQLLNAGRNPFLQDAQTLPALEKLTRYNLIAAKEAQDLSAAYCWLRDVEHRLQMENNLQTHTIPADRHARQRLAALMGCGTPGKFELAHRRHTDAVRSTYDNLLKGEEARAEASLPDLQAESSLWPALLTERSFRDPAKAFQLIGEFVSGPGYVHVSPRTSELALRLLTQFLGHCPTRELREQASHFPSPVLSDPDRVLARLDRFVSAYGARATLYELWTNNPSVFDLLIWVFDRSEFLAELAISTPDLVDELELSGRLRRSKTAAETLRDLRYGLDDPDQKLWIRRYHQAELMRIGLRDILGLADFEQNLLELSALAEACLTYSLEVAWRKHEIKKVPLAIIGFGKLGGSELNYGSDLDITFVTEAKVKELPQLQNVAIDVLDLLSTPTELGIVFRTDARLRPDGEKGLLVNTLAAYRQYYRHRAQLWEIQALSRTRHIAGHAGLGAKFESLSRELTDFSRTASPVARSCPGWKREIARMRQRIETERTPAGKKHLAIKTGAGGLIDAEFIAQTLCLANGWHEPNTLRALNLAREKKSLPREDLDRLIDNYRKLRRVEGILRRWSYAGETVLPDDPAPLYRVAVRCGFTDAEHFMAAVGGYRKAIREVYSKVMPKPQD